MHNSAHLIFNYFPELSELQKQQFTKLFDIYNEWNAKINVISRRDFGHFYEHHVLHSLAIAKFISFKKDSSILDIGTGGGFPGIPLAICFPDAQFTLADSIAKKIRVVEAVVADLNLQNVVACHARVETIPATFDFAVSRATAPLDDLVKWSFPRLKKKTGNGLIALKGGDIKDEIRPFQKKAVVKDVSAYFREEFFESKKIIYIEA